MFANFQPLGNQLLIKLLTEERRSESGIWLGEAEHELFHLGIVMASGPDTLQIKIGDKVAFTPYQGIAVDDQLRIIKEDLILGIFPSC